MSNSHPHGGDHGNALDAQCVPETLLPIQLVPTREQSGEMALLWAILERAFLDLHPSEREPGSRPWREDEAHRADALRFLTTGCVIQGGISLCDAFDLDPEYVARLAKRAHSQQSWPVSRGRPNRPQRVRRTQINGVLA